MFLRKNLMQTWDQQFIPPLVKDFWKWSSVEYDIWFEGRKIRFYCTRTCTFGWFLSRHNFPNNRKGFFWIIIFSFDAYWVLCILFTDKFVAVLSAQLSYLASLGQGFLLWWQDWDTIRKSWYFKENDYRLNGKLCHQNLQSN